MSYQTRTLDLAQYRTPGSRVFAGRDRGAHVRDAAGVAEFERDFERKPADAVLVVKVPEDTLAISSSFLLALFGDTIRRLNAENFRSHVRFEGKLFPRLVDQAVSEALAAEQPLELG